MYYLWLIGHPLCALNYWIFQSDFTLSEVKRQKQRGMAKGLRRQPWHSGKVAYHVQQTTTSVGSRVTQVQLRPVAIYLMAMPDYDWGSVLLGSTTRKGLQVMHQCFPHVCNHQCTSSKCGSSHSKKPWKTSPRILKRSRSFFGSWIKSADQPSAQTAALIRLRSSACQRDACSRALFHCKSL